MGFVDSSIIKFASYLPSEELDTPRGFTIMSLPVGCGHGVGLLRSRTYEYGTTEGTRLGGERLLKWTPSGLPNLLDFLSRLDLLTDAIRVRKMMRVDTIDISPLCRHLYKIIGRFHRPEERRWGEEAHYQRPILEILIIVWCSLL